MKKISLLLVMVLVCSIAFTQEEEKEDSKRKGKKILPFRVGLKVGIPNGFGGNIEYVTPLLKDRIAFFGDYSGFSADISDVDTKLQYFEIGTNIYLFGGKGRGLYGSLSYGKLNIDAIYTDTQTIDGQTFTGEASGDFEVSTLNVKAGLKMRRRFYFKTELGYGFGSVPQEIVITGNVIGVPAVGVDDITDIPGMTENGYVMFNIGFGIGF